MNDLAYPTRWVFAFGRSDPIHDLRHTTATLPLAQGVDVRTVADVLGHSDVATTLRTYVRTTEGSARRAAQAMGEALG